MRKRSGERVCRRNPIFGFRRGWVGPKAEYALDCHSMWSAPAGYEITLPWSIASTAISLFMKGEEKYEQDFDS